MKNGIIKQQLFMCTKLFPVSLILLILFLNLQETFAQIQKNENTETGFVSINGTPVYKKFNRNRISTWIKNDGEADINPSGYSGFEYPRRSGKTAVFQSGFLWGGKVSDQVRIGGSVYRQGTVPGKILNSGVPASQLIAEDPDAPNVRNFRVRPDYLTGSVQAEIDDSEGSESEIRTAYELDWNEWPANDGAPFEDIDNDGIYNPEYDIPGIPGADQTIWFVCNDTDPVKTQYLYGSSPIGIEEQVTVWGYNEMGPMGNMLFKKYVLVNKSNTTIEDFYISIWNDPDLGDAADDFIGYDTTLGLTYVYNANPIDAIYGLSPPAVGFKLLQGPIVPGNPTDTARYYDRYVVGKKNLPSSAHYFFISGDPTWRDPLQGQYQGALQFYNFFQGKIGFTGDPFTDPTTGDTTKFALYGDPVEVTGWIDGMLHQPGDRRAGLAAGPFNLEPGDAQEIVIAEIAAFGSSNLQSISVLKSYALTAQEKYNNFFDIITGVHNDEPYNPIDFKLYQNHPNPFNPSTKIGWKSPVEGWQTLKVYDVLGREVTTLVDEFKTTGKYEIDFNASKLSSGVYYYQLRAGSFIETKKMVFVR